MNIRVGTVAVAVLVFVETSFAQITSISGSRGISMSTRLGSGPVTSYSNSAPGEVQLFNDSHTIWGSPQTQAWIESSVALSQWVINGSASANAQFAPEGSFASAEVFASMSFDVDPGTNLQVTCRSGGSYGNMNSIVRVNGAGLNILITGGQNAQYSSQSVLVTELSRVSLYARGHGYSTPGPLSNHGWFEVTITATTVPAPAASGLIALAGVFATRRNRR